MAAARTVMVTRLARSLQLAFALPLTLTYSHSLSHHLNHSHFLLLTHSHSFIHSLTHALLRPAFAHSLAYLHTHALSHSTSDLSLPTYFVTARRPNHEFGVQALAGFLWYYAIIDYDCYRPFAYDRGLGASAIGFAGDIRRALAMATSLRQNNRRTTKVSEDCHSFALVSSRV